MPKRIVTKLSGLRNRREFSALVIPVAELLALLAVALTVDQRFFEGSRYWNAGVDPFLLIVLLLSAQYGAGFGVVAALASTAVLLASPLPALTLSHDLYSYSVMIAQRPVTWMVCALVLGGISGQHILRKRRLDRQLEEADQQRNAVAAAYVESRQANEALILRLNCERMTLSSVSDAIRKLLKPSIDEVAAGVDELMAVTFGARKFSLYQMGEGRLEVLRSQGWGAEDEYARTFSEHSPLFRAVVEDRRLLCVANPLDEVYLGRDGLLAGPICDPGSGDVLGMLKIEDLDFIRFGAEAIDNFRIAAEWLGFAFTDVAGPRTARIDLSRHEPVSGPERPALHSLPTDTRSRALVLDGSSDCVAERAA
jgi:hypothetical protein